MELVNEAIASGVMGYLVKPVSARQLVPSIQTAYARFEDLYRHLAHRFGQRTASLSQLEALIDQFSFAIFIVGDGQRVLYRNRSAQRLLDDQGLLIYQSGRLRVRDAARRDGFSALLNAVLGHDPRQHALMLGDGNGGHAAQAWAAPLSPGGKSDSPTAVLVVIDPDQVGTLPAGLLEALYGLTAKEANLARAMVRGWALDAYCDDTCISLNTARTHLKSIYRKTGTNRQADLVRLLSQWPLALGGNLD